MQTHAITKLAWGLAYFSLAKAACHLKNEIDSFPDLKDGSTLEWDNGVQLCDPQNDGNYQLAMMASLISVPTFAGGNALGGTAGTSGFLLLDSKCVPLGVFAPDGNDCGIPYQIDYFKDLPLVIDSIYWDASAPRMGFTFDGESYSFQDDYCGGCDTALDDGVRAVGSCMCGFYVGSGPPEDVGTCVLEDYGKYEDLEDEYEWNQNLCKPQGAGNFQLSFTSGSTLTGLYDSECRKLAWYRPDLAGSDCGLPMKIDYFGKDKSIVITKLDDNEDNPVFTFEYNGRSYGSYDDWCGGCVGEECKCGFYVGG